MSSYRRGAVLGLTVAETFILLAFLLLIAVVGLAQWAERQRDEARDKAEAEREAREEAERARDEAKRVVERGIQRLRMTPPEPGERDTPGPQKWVPPEKIETLVAAAERLVERGIQHMRMRKEAEHQRDKAVKEAEAARRAPRPGPGEPDTPGPQKWVPPEDIETLLAQRDEAVEEAKVARRAQKEAERARAAAERQRDQAVEEAKVARKAQKEAEQARDDAERERDQAVKDLATLRRKGVNPPCWYQVVPTRSDKTREKAYYAFNVAIYEDGIELARRPVPPGGADDDGGGLYADEWERLQIEALPYGERLSDSEFTDKVKGLVAQGKNRQVRTYECVFSVAVWDKTPDHAKKRWQEAHDRIIEGSFSAYTVRDDPWPGDASSQ